MRGRGMVAAACVATVLTVASCHKADTHKADSPSVATIVKRDNAICHAYARRINTIATPGFDPTRATRGELRAAARYLDKVVPLMQAQQDHIESTGRPSASQDLYASVLHALTAVIRDEQAARTAAHAADLRAFQNAYRADASDARHLAGVAQQFGLTGCLGG